MGLGRDDRAVYVFVGSGVLAHGDHTYSNIVGRYSGHSFEWDNGDGKQIKGSYKLHIRLVDDAEYAVIISWPTTGSIMFARALKGLKLGDMIRIRVWPGTDNSKVTVLVMDQLSPDGEWVPMEREDWSGLSPDEKIEKAGDAIATHIGFNKSSAPEPEAPKAPEPEPPKPEPHAASIDAQRPAIPGVKGAKSSTPNRPASPAKSADEYDPFGDE